MNTPARTGGSSSRSPFSPIAMESQESNYEAAAVDTTQVTDDLLDMMRGLNVSDGNDPDQENLIIDWEKERDQMDRYFDHQSKEKLQELPRYVQPAEFKKTTKLLPHQKDGVRWLKSQEIQPHPNPFHWERTLSDGTVAYYDRLSRHKLGQPYPAVKGAILADEMGLGKTLQLIALILSNPPLPPVEGHPLVRICTLVLCPKTVVSTWQNEIDKFVKPDALRVVVFDGTPNQRSKIIQKVRSNEIDILIATYDRVGRDIGQPRDYNGYGRPLLTLFDTWFYRIILDEAQEIRNSSSKKYKGTIQIAQNAQYRVALTGTPLVNSPNDVYSLLSFVGLAPFNDKSVFNHFIANPIRNRKRIGLAKLRAALTYVAFRRTKAVVKGLSLVPKNVELVRVHFPSGSGHKQVHDYWFDKTKTAFVQSEAESSKEAAQEKFAMQIKLRQSCASGELAVPEGMNPETLPMAPKLFALLRAMDSMKSDEKGVVFSQWNSFLDVVELQMTKEGHKVVRLDGSMSREARTKSMEALENDPSVKFILCGLKAGGCGINLTRANIVFFMDPWWNDATEMQAVDRCHRVGQTRPVRVYRFVMKGSIEEKMVTNIQEAKSKLGKGAMAHLTAEELKLTKIMTLKELFGNCRDGDVDGVDDEIAEDGDENGWD